MSSQTHIKFLIFIFLRVFTFSGITQKKNTQSHFVNELHAFCPLFFNYHMKKHRRGLMHTSFSISSHMFTYIIDMYVWFPVYWFSVYITSILVAAEIAKENHILKVTFWVYCTRLAPFCRTFIIEKHQRRLMHVSYCISSHIFAYINHINTLWFRMVIPSLAAAEIETAKNLLKVTSWTNYKGFAHYFFCDSCPPQL